MKTGFIYSLVDPHTGEIRYVGKTTQKLHTRLQAHLAPSKILAKTHKNSWIKSLSGSRPLISMIQELDSSDLDSAEVYWIKFFREQGCPLTNLTDGGEGASPGRKNPQTPEGRRRIAEFQRLMRGRPVIETISGRSYPSGRAAEAALNLYEGAVGRVLSGKQRQAAGFQFRLQGEHDGR